MIAFLFRKPQLGQTGADRVERGHCLAHRDLEVVLRLRGAVLHDFGVPGVHQHGIDRDSGRLDVGTEQGLALIDLCLGAPAVVSTVLSVQAVREQDDCLLRIVGLCRRAQRDARSERHPSPGQADRLIGGAYRLQLVDFVLQCGPVVAQAHHLRRTVIGLFGRKHRRSLARR